MARLDFGEAIKTDSDNRSFFSHAIIKGSQMHYEINGTIMQTLALNLSAGDVIYSQTNSMAWMSDGIRMDTHTGGGILEGLKRSFGGGSFFVTDFIAEQDSHIAFAPRFPGTIIAQMLAPGQSLICRKESFLCAQKSVMLEIAWQRRFGAGLFGGEGFILQKVTGPGMVWLDLSGELIERDLAPGERLLVHAGHVGLQDPSVEFDIQMVSGFKNILFGGEGLFLASLTGPGHVWLQSMPIMNLAEEIGRYLPERGEINSRSSSGAAAIIGGVLGGMLNSGQTKSDNGTDV